MSAPKRLMARDIVEAVRRLEVIFDLVSAYHIRLSIK